MSVTIQLKVNGRPVTAEVRPDTLLSALLREQLRLTGTHIGCDTASCGACTVHLDGRAVKSCNVLAAQAQGREVTTIEGITPADGSLHPMQAAFKACHGLQCGFCTPGMVMCAIDMVHPSAARQRRGDPRGPRGESLPLHRLSQHRQGGRAGARAMGR